MELSHGKSVLLFKCNFYTIFWVGGAKNRGNLTQFSVPLYLHVQFFNRAIEGLLALLLQHILRYRLDVIKSNLQSVFPYTSPAQLRQDIRDYYRYLGLIIRQTIAGPSGKRLERSITMERLSLLDQWLGEGRSAIVLMGHTGNWEWVGSYLAMIYEEDICILYKKIKNDQVNTFILGRRKTHARHLVEISQMGELLRLMKRQPVLVVMIADQNPGSDQGIIWADFLGRDTAFVNGPESLSTRYALPVVFTHVDSTSDGKYHIRFVPIHDGESMVAPGEITRRFADALGQTIRSNRIQWLWSHRRWKRKRPVS